MSTRACLGATAGNNLSWSHTWQSTGKPNPYHLHRQHYRMPPETVVLVMSSGSLLFVGMPLAARAPVEACLLDCVSDALAWTMCGCCARDATEDRPPHNAPVRRRAPPGQCACTNNLTLAGVAVVHSCVKLIPRSCDYYLNPRNSASIPRTTSGFKFHQKA